MPGYTDTIGGAPVGVADGNYSSFALTENITLQWAQYAVTEHPFSRLMDVTPEAQDLTFQLPDASLAAVGEACIVNNKGAFAFTLLDGGGNTLAVIQPSEVRYVYLMDSSSAAGLWALVLFGKSNSSQDASQFAGPGLKAINNTLAWAPLTTLMAGTGAVDTSHRAKVIVWTGGSGTVTLPDTSSLGGDFVFEFRNQGTGVATLEPHEDQLIDGSANAQFNLNESCLVHASSTGWYTVGRGRSVQFAFTQLVKDITGGGGTTTLSLSEASSVIQTYEGALTGTSTVILPAVVQVYYVSNQTTGGNNIQFKNPDNGGSTVTLEPGQNAVLFSDGTNVINANTTSSGLSTLVLAAGTATSPPISVGGATTGLYSPGTNELGVTVNGVGVCKWDANGAKITASDGRLEVVAPSGESYITIDRTSGQMGGLYFRTAGVNRFSIESSPIPETGDEIGSDMEIWAYTDAGVPQGVATVSRASREFIFAFLPIAAGATMVNVSASQTLTNKTIDGANNTLRNINLATQVSGILPAANGGTGGESGIINTIASKLIVARVQRYNNVQYFYNSAGPFQSAPGFEITLIAGDPTHTMVYMPFTIPANNDTWLLGGGVNLPAGRYRKLDVGYINAPGLWVQLD